jgi:hypothetical protein
MVKHGRDKKRRAGRTGKTKLKVCKTKVLCTPYIILDIERDAHDDFNLHFSVDNLCLL